MRPAARERAAAAARRSSIARRPPGHWLLFALCIVTLVGMLLLQGISAHTVGASSTGSGGGSGASPLASAGPVLSAGPGGRLVSRARNPRHRIALTFDDGPSSRYTPQILAVLRRFHVRATFFVVGTQAVQHPGLLRAEARAGNEIGNHTFTHVDLAAVPGWEASQQIALTQSAIAGITGQRPRLLRPPYSSTPDAVTPHELTTLKHIAADGYFVTLASYDAEDWSRPGVGQIVRNATPPSGKGGIVLMHDAGGNRAETVAALKILIPRLLHAGYRFETVSQLAGLPRTAVDMHASSWERTRGSLLVGALRAAAVVTAALTLIVLAVGVLTVLRMLAVLILARRHARRETPFDPSFTPPVSIVVPAHNEEVDIGKSVRSLAASDYPQVEVIVVDDGSTDATADIVERMDHPRVRLVRQANRGKAEALNRGIDAARYDVLVTVDADTVFERGTVRQLVQPFRQERVGAVSGNTKVANRRGLLGRWQHIEYVMGFNLDRRMYEELDCMPTVPGAIGGFRRTALAEIGGISGATLAEDTDVTMAIGRHGWRVVYAQDARAYTEAPSTLSGLWRQRYRWAYGTLQALWKHRGAVLRRGEPGRIGRRALPYLALFQIALPFAAPLIDLFALYGILFLDPLPVLAYWVAFNLFQLALAVYAFRLDRERLRPLWAMPLQQFVYRQLMYLVVYQSVVAALRGVRLGWQHVARTGEVSAPATRP